MQILCLTARLPYPPNRGDRLRAYHFIRELSREHRITLLSFIADDSESANLAPLRPFCADIHLVHRTPWQSAVGTALNAWRPFPFQSLYYRSPVMQQAVDRLMAREHFDAVYVHLFRMAQYVSRRRGVYRIVDLTDAISQEVERSLPYRDPFWRLVYRLELPRIRRYEREVLRGFEETWLISEADRQALLDNGGQGNAQVVPNGVDALRYHPLIRPPVAEPRLIFVGHMGVFHNIDAAEYLAREILPAVRQAVPAARLDLVGSEPAPRVAALASEPGVRVRGHVTDLNEALNDAAVFVAPLRFAAGIQNKVLEAMAAGLPVVTTEAVNQGLRAEPGRDLLVAADTAGLVDCVVALLRDPARRAALGAAARDFVVHTYRWDEVLDRVRVIQRKN